MEDSTRHRPRHLDLKKEEGLAIEWMDGQKSFFSIAFLRKMSPSADQRQLREEIQKNPLTVLPASNHQGPLVATDAEMIGNYALRIVFSDGHNTGLYSWDYLRQLHEDEQKNEQKNK